MRGKTVSSSLLGFGCGNRHGFIKEGRGKMRINRRKMGLALTALTLAALLLLVFAAVPAWAGNTYYVTKIGNDTSGDGSSGNPWLTISYALTQVSAGDTINVAAGTYNENITIDKAVTLLSASGKDVTTIEGDVALGGELGTVLVTNNTNGVQIGDVGQGFTIIGIDGPPGLEKAAVYFQGNHSNAIIKGNNIVADGDAGLQTEWGATISGFVISNNKFSGQTFAGTIPGGEGFALQFSEPNVPRQLVAMGGGSGGGNTSNITFTNNQITGTAGGINSSGDPQGNTLVTIDSVGSTITSNVFEGTTTRYGTSLRARGPNATISGNDFRSTGLTSTNGHLYLQNNALDSALVAANTFDKGVYVEDVNGGTIGPSIQGFVDAVLGGTTINVVAGIYNEDLIIDKSLTLEGAQAGVDARGRSASESEIVGVVEVTSAATNVLFDGLKLTSPTRAFTPRGFNLHVESESSTIKNCILVAEENAGHTYSGYLDFGGITNTTVERNSLSGHLDPTQEPNVIRLGVSGVGTVTIANNEMHDVGGGGGIGIMCSNADAIINIEANEIDNTGDGIWIWNGGATSYFATISITHNHIHDCAKKGVKIVGDADGTLTVNRNSIHGSAEEGVFNGVVGLAVTGGAIRVAPRMGAIQAQRAMRCLITSSTRPGWPAREATPIRARQAGSLIYPRLVCPRTAPSRKASPW